MPDAVVIGGGPAGYMAGIRLAQLGASVVVVERERMGGECLNWGCIPSKALIEAANAYHRLGWLREIGMEVGEARVDQRRLREWKDGIVRKLTQGVEYLLKFYGASIIHGAARIREGGVEVITGGSRERIDAEKTLIATGTEPISLPQAPLDGKRIIGFKEILSLEEVPPRLLVIGGGAIGLEMGTAYRKLGSEVTVVEIMETVLPGMERDLSRIVERRLRELGVTLHLNSSVLSTSVMSDGVEVGIKTQDGELRESFDYVLVSVGKRAAEIEGLGSAGIERDGKGFIKVDHRMRTSNERFYAAGDVTGPPFLAHKAYRQGIVAAEAMMGLPSTYEPQAMPLAVFTDPEVASAGMTEEEARRVGLEVSVSRFGLQALGRALTTGETEGVVKVVYEKTSKRILGVHIAGPHASELISEASVLLEYQATLEDVAQAIHPHPTFSEALIEAVEDALGRPLHRARKLART